MNEKILIVEDDTDILELLMASLASKKYQVKGTLSCAEGLKIFYSFQPDLVILDINVGSEDGRQVCIEIKSHAIYQHIPVIMISAMEQGLSYLDYGANDYLKKPFTLSDLESICLKHLKQVS